MDLRNDKVFYSVLALVIALGLVYIGVVVWGAFFYAPKHRMHVTITVSPKTIETTTTYLGIKCIVNGHEVRTDLKSAAAAGCK